MVEEIDPAQFDEWLAYQAIEPLDDSLARETLVRMATAICRGLGMDVELDLFRVTTEPGQARAKPASVAALKACLGAFAAVHNASVH